MSGGKQMIWKEMLAVPKCWNVGMNAKLRDRLYGLVARASQCGRGGGSGCTLKFLKPASSSQPRSSSAEKTQPFCVVNPMVSAKMAEKGGWV